MIIYEPRQLIKVNTPKGEARILFVTEYGIETPKLFTCIIDKTGEIWEFLNHEIKVDRNRTAIGFEGLEV